jgi:hypothetical protein
MYVCRNEVQTKVHAIRYGRSQVNKKAYYEQVYVHVIYFFKSTKSTGVFMCACSCACIRTDIYIYIYIYIYTYKPSQLLHMLEDAQNVCTCSYLFVHRVLNVCVCVSCVHTHQLCACARHICTHTCTQTAQTRKNSHVQKRNKFFMHVCIIYIHVYTTQMSTVHRLTELIVKGESAWL